MVIKMTNESEGFYGYMGKAFGSRLIENQVNDRIYDDDKKVWYLYIQEEKVKAFVSIKKNVIKNVYATKEEYLERVLEEVKKENKITYSIVANCYTAIYEKCGFKIWKPKDYKNFVTIYMEKCG